MSRLPENNVTQSDPKRDADPESENLDLGPIESELTGPLLINPEADVLGGDLMTPEAQRQYINLKRERYQISSSK